MQTKVMHFTFDHGVHTYDAYRQVISNTDGWVLLRRKTANPNIPPYTETLTKKGWLGVLSCNAESVIFLSEDDATGYVESQ